jgi:hypothetical protein
MPPAPPQGIPAAGGDPDGDDDDASGSSSHSTELLEEQEPKGWIARPITRDATRGCYIHDALDTLLHRAFDRHTWSIEYRCVVYQHRRGLYPDQWEATCLVHRSYNDLRGVDAFLEHYSITERDTGEAAMQDAARRALSQYCSLFSGVADGLNLKYYPRHSIGSAGGVIVSPVGEGNPRLNNMVNLATMLNTELDHALDKLGKVRAEVAELSAECAAHHYLDGGSPAPVGIHRPVVASIMVSLIALGYRSRPAPDARHAARNPSPSRRRAQPRVRSHARTPRRSRRQPSRPTSVRHLELRSFNQLFLFPPR